MSSRAESSARWLRRFGLGLVLVAGGLVAPQVAIAADAPTDRSAFDKAFTVHTSPDGIVLEPKREGAPFKRIEIPDEGHRALVNDDKELDATELASWLGEEGALAAGLLTVDAAARRSLLGLPALASPIEAPEPPAPPRLPRIGRHSSDARVSFGRSVTIAENETADDIVCFAGTLEILGIVQGDAVAIGGSVRVKGKVMGDAVAVGGSITLDEGAEVFGEVSSVGGTITRAPGAKVHGKVAEVAFGEGFERHGRRQREGGDVVVGSEHHDEQEEEGEGWDLLHGLVAFVLLTLLVGLALLVAHGPAEAVAARVRSEAWSAGLAGLLGELLLVPVLVLLVVVLVISVIGIPLLLLIPFLLVGLALAALVGFAGVALALGRWLAERFNWSQLGTYAMAAVGVAAIVALSLFGELLDLGGRWTGFFGGVIAGLGVLTQYLAWTIGFGAVLLGLIAYGRRRRELSVQARIPLVSPPPPPPAPEEPPTEPTPES